MAGRTYGLVGLAAFLLVLSVGLMGCGPKPPCEGADVTAVQSAQDECAAANDKLDGAREERAGLEAELTEARAELGALQGQPAALAERLHALKKGSGR